MASRTQRQRREDAQQALVAAARELIGTKGYAATTFEEIGRRAGTSRGLVTYHFGSKLKCIQAVVADLRASTIADLVEGAEGLRGLPAIERLVERYLELYEMETTRGRALFVTMAEAISATPELADVVAEHDRAFRQLIVDRLEEAKVDGELASDVDCMIASVLIAGMLRGVAQQWLVDPAAVDLSNVVPCAASTASATARAATPL
jgi:AcrR family transcriptional regulator